jgi:membrane-bound lytic murein transglycosylase B
MLRKFFISLLACGVLPVAATAAENSLPAGDEQVRGFADRMAAEHGFSAEDVRAVLADAEIKQNILDAISRPAEKTKPWHEYRKIFLTEERIDQGARFWAEHKDAIDQASRRFGVDPAMIVAIVGVETFYGRRTGSFRVLDALATLGFRYPPRAAFFQRELEEFLLLTRDQGLDPRDPKGSYAGAMGAPQFISSSYRAYAVDGDGDGRIDLWNSWPDVVSSVANYFSVHGWETNGPVATRATARGTIAPGSGLKLDNTVDGLAKAGVGFEPAVAGEAPATLIELEGTDGPEYWVAYKNFYVITRYNRSRLYAMAAHDLAQAINERAGQAG